MKRHMKKYIMMAAALAVSSISVLSLRAQTLPSLMINQDPATLAMGSAGVAAGADAFALQNNVAAMSFSEEKMSVQAGFGMWQPGYAGMKTIGLGGMYSVSEKLAVGLDFKYLMMPSYSGITGNGSAIRDSEFKPSEMNIAAGVSYAFIDCLSAGVTLRYAGSILAADAKGSAFGADFGLYFSKNSIHAGLSVNNLGTKVKYSGNAYAQPMYVKAGAGYDLIMGASTLAFAAEADILFAGGIMAGAGCEYSFKDLVFARAGYHYGNSVNVVPSHASAGLGLKIAGVTLDFAYLFVSKVLSNSLCVSLGYCF